MRHCNSSLSFAFVDAETSVNDRCREVCQLNLRRNCSWARLIGSKNKLRCKRLLKAAWTVACLKKQNFFFFKAVSENDRVHDALFTG